MAEKASGKPPLLSSGNPQIPKGDGDEPVQANLDAMPGWKREVGGHLDDLIVRAVPELDPPSRRASRRGSLLSPS